MTTFHVKLLALVSEQLIRRLKMFVITLFKYDETISDKSLPAQAHGRAGKGYGDAAWWDFHISTCVCSVGERLVGRARTLSLSTVAFPYSHTGMRGRPKERHAVELSLFQAGKDAFPHIFSCSMCTYEKSLYK